MKIHKIFMKNEKRKGALGKSDSTGGYGPYLTKYFLQKNGFRKNSKNSIQNVNMQKGFEFLWVLDDVWSKNRKIAKMS